MVVVVVVVVGQFSLVAGSCGLARARTIRAWATKANAGFACARAKEAFAAIILIYGRAGRLITWRPAAARPDRRLMGARKPTGRARRPTMKLLMLALAAAANGGGGGPLAGSARSNLPLGRSRMQMTIDGRPSQGKRKRRLRLLNCARRARAAFAGHRRVRVFARPTARIGPRRI